MVLPRLSRSQWMLTLAALTLTACGGGAGNGAGETNVVRPAVASTQEPNAPQATGDTATDGLNWFNFRRQQLGLPAVAANTTVDRAAQAHSAYQTQWGITHYQTEGRTGFTGVCLYDNEADPQCQPAKVSRLESANYRFAQRSYAFGEVISAMSDSSGANAAEGLIGAIYHRFVIFEPMFKEAGVGKAVNPNGVTYFTTNFVSDGLEMACAARGRIVHYPFAGQQGVPPKSFTDTQVPDPVPEKNEVGYPVSMHADIIARLNVQSFTVQPRGGAPLAVRTLTSATDPEHTSSTVAAVVPLAVLAPNTTYEAQFVGTVEYGATADCPALTVPVNSSWTFTTR